MISIKSGDKVIIVRPKFLHSKNSAPLALVEQRILMYAIWKVQRNNKVVSFTKAELEDFIKVDLGNLKAMVKSISILRGFGMEIFDEANEHYISINAFESLDYNKGLFTFKFTNSFLPQVSRQKERFLQFGLNAIAQFKSKYTLYLYDYLKDCMWGPINKKENIDLQTFRDIFRLEKEEYLSNTNFKTRCWQVAMNEINEKTLYSIEIVSKGRGDNTNFSIYMYQDENFKKINEASKFECKLGKVIINDGCANCMFVNKCPAPFDYGKAESIDDVQDVLRAFMLKNSEYSLAKRIQNNVADEFEQKYWVMLNVTKTTDAIDRGNLEQQNQERIDDMMKSFNMMEE